MMTTTTGDCVHKGFVMWSDLVRLVSSLCCVVFLFLIQLHFMLNNEADVWQVIIANDIFMLLTGGLFFMIWRLRPK